MAIQAYVLIQTSVGMSTDVAKEIAGLTGVIFAADAGPNDVIAKVEADHGRPGRDGRLFSVRTLTCAIVNL